MSLTRTGPGPVWASGGEMVTVTLGSAVSGISKAVGGRLSRRLTLTRPGTCLWASVSPSCTRLGPSPCPVLTDSTWISVIFQKAFQKCTSRFCTIRSNSAPRSSGSMAKRPPCSPKDTSPMEMVCRNGRIAGVNCGDTPPSQGPGVGRSGVGQRHGG
uniref:Uncharacterized protein n=1 Tax=Balaenoptera musculus TaxID=9771 RepID=A0A8C0DSC6_BALMU